MFILITSFPTQDLFNPYSPSQDDCKPYTKQERLKDYPHCLSLPITQRMPREGRRRSTAKAAPIGALLPWVLISSNRPPSFFSPLILTHSFHNHVMTNRATTNWMLTLNRHSAKYFQNCHPIYSPSMLLSSLCYRWENWGPETISKWVRWNVMKST